MDGWVDGWTDKTETTAVPQRTHIPSKKWCEGEQVWFRGTESIQTKGDARRMEVEDSGCQDWHWDGVRSHFSSVITLCLLLSPLRPITATMKQAPSCRAAYGSLVVTPSLPSEAMRFFIDTVCEKLNRLQQTLLFDRVWAAALTPCRDIISCECLLATSLLGCLRLKHLLSVHHWRGRLLFCFWHSQENLSFLK